MLKMAWRDSLLNTIFSFARSSWIQILFEPSLILSMASVFVSVSSSFTVRWVSSVASEVGSTSYLVALPFCGVFRIVSHSCSAFPSSTLFPEALSVILEFRLLRLLLLLLLYLPKTLQRDLGWRPWCLRVVRKILDLRSEKSLDNAISWHCCVGDDCKRLCLPESQSLILRFWQSCVKYRILIAFPMCLKEQCLRNIVINITRFFFWVFSGGIQGCTKDWLSDPVILFASRNSTTPQNGLKMPGNSPVEDVFLPIASNKRVIHQFWTCWNTTRVSLNSS